jgi:hypothetical protein
MTIHFSADFTHRLVTRFDEYKELERVLKMWGLELSQISTPERSIIERTGSLHDRMKYCFKDSHGNYDWVVGSRSELASAISLIHAVADDIGYAGLGILRIGDDQ